MRRLIGSHTRDRARTLAATALSAAVLLATGCRLDAGVPDYSSHVGLPKRSTAADENLPGPHPYVAGTPRLMVGMFYEGGASDRLVLGATRHYYIFAIEGTTTLTYTQETADDRVEGKLSDRLTLAGTPWWGGGVLWDGTEDLSAWTTMVVSVKSSDPSLESLAVRMGSGSNYSVDASDYGFAADGDWHTLEIPLADFVAKGLDLTKVSAPFILGGDRPASGESLLVDDLYFTKD